MLLDKTNLDLSEKSPKKNRFYSVVSLILVVALTLTFISGCSTPTYGVFVKDGSGNEVEKFTTGEYISFLYQTFNTGMYSYYFQYFEEDKAWAYELSYDDGTESGKKLTLEEHVVQTTLDNIAYFKAAEKLMKDNKIEFSEEDKKAISDSVAAFGSSGEKLGFNKESYEKSTTLSYRVSVLFNALYGEDGIKPVSESDKKAYFKDNILTYKIVEKSLVDSENASLSEAEIAKIKETLNGYLDTFNKDESKDFNAILKKDYDANKEEDDEEFPVDDSLKALDQNLKNLNVPDQTNEALAAEIKKISFGEAKVVEYTNSSGIKQMALIYNVNPEDSANYNYEKVKETVLYYMKNEEYEKEIKAIADTYKVELNAEVRKKCTPRQMYSDAKKS